MNSDFQADGLYDRIPELLVVEDPARPVAFQPHPAGGGHRVKVAHLDGEARRRLLIDGPRGLEPAAFWLSESGMPVAVSTWKSLF
ncbi:MAG TPA: hypothetical protein VFG35_00860, partial [Actinoplanes sp.]|nr:hypothetical protein [Actinoplanes sp.]